MTKDTMQLTRPPGVSLKGLQERKVLEAKLLGVNTQLQGFGRLRDEFAASGKDADAKYRQMQARRDQLMVHAAKLPPAPDRVGSAFGVPAGPIGALPVAPTVFLPPHYSASYGYSGRLAFGSPAEGIDAAIPEGTEQMSGSFSRGAIFEPSVVAYVGKLKVAPPGGPTGDLALNYIWMHSWNYLILFPPAGARCLVTYSLGMLVTANVLSHAGHVNLSSFVSFGETADFEGEDVPTDSDSWPPFSVDLSQRYSVNGSSYNGTSGVIQGPSSMQGSFLVAAGRTPALAVSVGVISSQSNDSVLSLGTYPDCSFIYPGGILNQGDPTHGFVTFNYQPLPEGLSPR